MNSKTMATFRVEKKLWAEFLKACKADDVSASQIIRCAIREYIRVSFVTCEKRRKQ